MTTPAGTHTTGHTADWTNRFEPFTLQHAVVAGCFVVAIACVAIVGRRLRRTTAGIERERLLRRWAVGFSCIVAVLQIVYYLLPGQFELSVSLPLQLCDLAVIVAPIALSTQARWARTLLYFWGLLLSSQGFITPTLESGITHPRFWLFWVSHTIIVGSAVYDIVALGYRPTRRDLCFAMVVSGVYALLVSAINLPLGLNYGFLGKSRPGNPTIVDSLGDWPLRVGWIALIGYSVQVLGWAVWPMARRLAGLRAEDPSSLSPRTPARR